MIFFAAWPHAMHIHCGHNVWPHRLTTQYNHLHDLLCMVNGVTQHQLSDFVLNQGTLLLGPDSFLSFWSGPSPKGIGWDDFWWYFWQICALMNIFYLSCSLISFIKNYGYGSESRVPCSPPLQCATGSRQNDPFSNSISGFVDCLHSGLSACLYCFGDIITSVSCPIALGDSRSHHSNSAIPRAIPQWFY